MSRNTAKIKAGLRALTDKPYEIISGTVVGGSVDTSGYTFSVQPTDASMPIEGVMLSTISNGNGAILIPKDNSNVIIGTIDGPGAWSLIKANELEKAVVTIGNVQCEMDDTQVNIKNGEVVLNIGTSVFKMSTSNESLFGILNDLLNGLALLEVATVVAGSPVTSSVPINATTFVNLQTRLSNLLSA